MPDKLGRGPLAATLEEAADGVWLLRGDVKRGMNIYFLRDGDGVVQFDAGTQPMTSAARDGRPSARRPEADCARACRLRPPRQRPPPRRTRPLPPR